MSDYNDIEGFGTDEPIRDLSVSVVRSSFRPEAEDDDWESRQRKSEEFCDRVRTSLPAGYGLAETGMAIYKDTLKAGQEVICQPFYPLSRTISDGNRDATMTLVTQSSDGEEVHSTISQRGLGRGSPECISQLRNAGWRIYVKDAKFADLLIKMQAPVVDAGVSNCGWHKDIGWTCVLPDRRIVDNVDRDEKRSIPDLYVRDEAKLEQWKTEVGQLLSGNPLALLMICTALSGSVLRFLDTPSFILNIADRTSSGKTTLLKIASEVWVHESLHSWSMTRAAIDDVCLGSNDAFVAFDEIPVSSFKSVSDQVFAIANGTRRGARKRPGDLLPGEGWRVTGGSTSETPFFTEVEKRAQRKGRSSGQSSSDVKSGTFVRLIDVAVDREKEKLWMQFHEHETPGHFFQTISEASSRLASTAGPAFVDYLSQKVKQGENRLASHRKCAAQIANHIGVNPLNDDGQGMRVVNYFATILVAGFLAVDGGILPQTRKEVGAAVLLGATSWARLRRVGKFAAQEDPLASLRKWLNSNLGGALRPVDAEKRALTSTYARAGWFCENFYYLRTGFLQDFNDTEMSDKGFRDYLEENGILVRGGTKDCQSVRMSSLTAGGARVYQLDRQILDRDPSEDAGA